MHKNYLSSLIFSFLALLTVPILWSLGEMRLDVYISMYTLEYFVVKAIFNPRRVTRDYLAIALFIIFTVIVSYRVLEVLNII